MVTIICTNFGAFVTKWTIDMFSYTNWLDYVLLFELNLNHMNTSNQVNTIDLDLSISRATNNCRINVSVHDINKPVTINSDFLFSTWQKGK